MWPPGFQKYRLVNLMKEALLHLCRGGRVHAGWVVWLSRWCALGLLVGVPQKTRVA